MIDLTFARMANERKAKPRKRSGSSLITAIAGGVLALYGLEAAMHPRACLISAMALIAMGTILGKEGRE